MEFSLQQLLQAIRSGEVAPEGAVIHYNEFNLGMRVMSRDIKKKQLTLTDGDIGYRLTFNNSFNRRYWSIRMYMLDNPLDDLICVCSNSYHNVGRRLRSLSHGRGIIQGYLPA